MTVNQHDNRLKRPGNFNCQNNSSQPTTEMSSLKELTQIGIVPGIHVFGKY